jgi:predicted kinase
LPRSGKSTWCKKNGKNAIVISNDWIRKNILGTHYAHNANAIIWTIADATLRIVLGQGKNAILDGVNLTKFTRGFYIKLARQYKAKVRIVLFNASVSTCIKRNRHDNNISMSNLKKMSETYEPPTKDEYDEIINAKSS